MCEICEIDKQSGHTFYLRKGDILTVIDPQGINLNQYPKSLVK